jgi:molecular chaperone HscB
MSTYFDLLNIEPSFELDKKALKKTFFKQSKNVHPDHHDGGEDASAGLNDAYETLKDPVKRIRYILVTYLGDNLEKAQLPPEFLMEMMEVNEQVEGMDPNNAEEIERVQSDVQEQIDNQIAAALEKGASWSPGAADEKNILEAVKQDYYKIKYLLRLRETVGNIADSF